MNKHPSSFRDALRAKLLPSEREYAIYSFDVLGDMALVEIPRELTKKRALIANTLLETNPRVKKVFEKVGEHAGKYRVEKIRWMAGEKSEELVYTEWGCTFHMHPGKVFFNPRLSTERQRAAAYVKKGQSAVVFFGGVGPYAIEIAKHCSPKKVVSIEWNPAAKKFMNENIARNKVSELVEPLFGDIKKITPRAQFNHVIMPAPDNAIEFLPYAVKWLSPKGGLIQCYTFVSNESPEMEAREKVAHVLGKKTPFTLVFVRKVSDFSARKWQVCVGIRVSVNKRQKKK